MMSLAEMIRRFRAWVPRELVYFFRKRLQGRNYGIVIFSKDDPDVYFEDCLYTYGRNLQFLQDEKFVRAYDDAVARKLYVSPYMKWRLHTLCWAATVASRLEGDFVECGVNKGFCSKIIIDYVDFGRLGKKYYLLDTFAGFDDRQLSPKERARADKYNYQPCLDKVREVFGGYDFARIIPGRIPDTLPQATPEKVAFLHIDMNCVVPEVAALEHFYPRLIPGAIVLLDDYGALEYIDQKVAHDAFAREHGVQILTLPTGQGMFIKPPEGRSPQAVDDRTDV